MTTLDDMLNHADMLGMITTVIIGNSSTYNYDGIMINPRGYRSKYELIAGKSSDTI
jgi:precorrin-3B C17-methyltransferase